MVVCFLLPDRASYKGQQARLIMEHNVVRRVSQSQKCNILLCLKAPYFYLGCRELVCPIRAILEKINVEGAKHTSGGIMLVFCFFKKRTIDIHIH